MFGSDWPVCQLAATYQQVVDALDECLVGAGCSDADRAAVFGKNAARFYQL
jgi:L-fuconolactonase